ncbi:fumarylacetoacetate hydrolase [bacterium]|nr:fumarylacetoacetate hydrolase [bacterium]
MDKIVCLGKNYSEHAQELGEALPEKPVLFIKPPSVLRVCQSVSEPILLKLPKSRGSVHHECEIVLRVGSERKIDAVTLGLDMTLRDVQSELKKKGHPWTTSKVFPDSAVIGPWIPIQEFPNWERELFEFKLNGDLKQKGRAEEMILKVSNVIQYISQFFEIQSGDMIFTGTPAGVGPVNSGATGSLRWGPIHYEVKWQ